MICQMSGIISEIVHDGQDYCRQVIIASHKPSVTGNKQVDNDNHVSALFCKFMVAKADKLITLQVYFNQCRQATY